MSMQFHGSYEVGHNACDCCAVTRRRALVAVAGGMVAALGARSVAAQTTMSPDAALA
jgi:hypothetical protein